MKDGRVMVTVRMQPATHARLREAAYQLRMTMNDLALLALGNYLDMVEAQATRPMRRRNKTPNRQEK